MTLTAVEYHAERIHRPTATATLTEVLAQVRGELATAQRELRNERARARKGDKPSIWGLGRDEKVLPSERVTNALKPHRTLF